MRLRVRFRRLTRRDLLEQILYLAEGAGAKMAARYCVCYVGADIAGTLWQRNLKHPLARSSAVLWRIQRRFLEALQLVDFSYSLEQSAKRRNQLFQLVKTARRFDVSPDTVRNYCERHWLDCRRSRGNHHRITIRSIESFEAQRRSNQPNAQTVESPPRVLPVADEEFEIYYLGNETHPNKIEAGYVCNASEIWKGVTPSSILRFVGKQFGGGTFRIVRVRDGEVVSERTIYLPGNTKDEVVVTRDDVLDI
jgi:hypothetical protein